MHKLLIFGGTSEGRMLAQFCADYGIGADYSAATEYGASLLSGDASVRAGRLDVNEMIALLREKQYVIAVDATHPYAYEATQNIEAACLAAGTKYLRLIREPARIYGTSVMSLRQMVSRLNCSDDIILSTLGSKAIPELTEVHHYAARIWLRILPTDSAVQRCTEYGYDPQKLICEKGPFTVEQNLRHIELSGAKILITKESGAVGGYPEKVKAVRQKKIQMITLRRPDDSGMLFADIQAYLANEKERGTI